MKQYDEDSTGKSTRLTGKFQKRKRRAIELYHPDSPFWPKVENASKKQFKRRPKHRGKGGYDE